jgi:hypothetical protein
MRPGDSIVRIPVFDPDRRAGATGLVSLAAWWCRALAGHHRVRDPAPHRWGHKSTHAD